MKNYSHPDLESALIMPCLNEAENLDYLLPKLVANFRVVVVDNGSTDQSFAIAQKLGAEVVTCPKRGYGAAVLAGIDYLNAHPIRFGISCLYVVVFDADGTSPFNAIEQVIDPLRTRRADIVLAQRTQILRGAMPLHAKWGNRLQVRLIRAITGYQYLDMGPLRAMRLKTFSELNLADQTWGFNVEMQVKAALFKYHIEEVEIFYSARLAGKSKISGSLVGSIRASVKILTAIFYYYHVTKKSALKPRKSLSKITACS